MRKTVIVLLILLLVLAGIGALVYVWMKAPPRVVRLLPEADAYLYGNIKPVRLALSPVLGPLPKVQREPDYDDFVKSTGIDAERDLDEVAVAVHTQERAEPRFSSVFSGRFDRAKLEAYLRKAAQSTERYGSTDIFLLAIDGRTVRTAVLDSDELAVSNVESPLEIHGIIDRAGSFSTLFVAPTLVRSNYKEVPVGSLVWGIAYIVRPKEDAAAPATISFPLPPAATFVGSLRFTGSVEARILAITATPEEAQQLSQAGNTMLVLMRAMQGDAKGADPDVKRFFDSLQVVQSGNRATLEASIPIMFIQKMVSQPPPSFPAQAPAQGPAPEKRK